jgi:hypothetical protein
LRTCCIAPLFVAACQLQLVQSCAITSAAVMLRNRIGRDQPRLGALWLCALNVPPTTLSAFVCPPAAPRLQRVVLLQNDAICCVCGARACASRASTSAALSASRSFVRVTYTSATRHESPHTLVSALHRTAPHRTEPCGLICTACAARQPSFHSEEPIPLLSC